MRQFFKSLFGAYNKPNTDTFGQDQVDLDTNLPVRDKDNTSWKDKWILSVKESVKFDEDSTLVDKLRDLPLYKVSALKRIRIMLGEECFKIAYNEDNINHIINSYHIKTHITNKDLFKSGIDGVGKEPVKGEINVKFSLYNFLFIDNKDYFETLSKHLNSIDLILAISYLENIIINLVDNRNGYIEYSDFSNNFHKNGYDGNKEKIIQEYTKILFGLYSRVFKIEEVGIDYWYNLNRDIFVATLENFKGVNFELLSDISSYITKHYYQDPFYCYSGSDVEKYPIEYMTDFLKKTDIIGVNIHEVNTDKHKYISELLNVFGRLDPFFHKDAINTLSLHNKNSRMTVYTIIKESNDLDLLRNIRDLYCDRLDVAQILIKRGYFLEYYVMVNFIDVILWYIQIPNNNTITDAIENELREYLHKMDITMLDKLNTLSKHPNPYVRLMVAEMEDMPELLKVLATDEVEFVRLKALETIRKNEYNKQ